MIKCIRPCYYCLEHACDCCTCPNMDECGIETGKCIQWSFHPKNLFGRCIDLINVIITIKGILSIGLYVLCGYAAYIAYIEINKLMAMPMPTPTLNITINGLPT